MARFVNVRLVVIKLEARSWFAQAQDCELNSRLQ
jgi:hypothetical protein